MPTPPDGGDEVSPFTPASAPASEPPHSASQGHRRGHVRCGWHGCYERYNSISHPDTGDAVVEED